MKTEEQKTPDQILEPIQAKNSPNSRNKLRDNKILFYGIPLLVVMIVFGGLLFFVLPSIQYYSLSRSQSQMLDKNNLIVDKSIGNLNKVYSQEDLIKSYSSSLNQYIPIESKLGDIINIIQTKAKDFNLESKVGVYNGVSNTSVANLAKKDGSEKALFESITSGEVTFQPKSLDKDVDAVLSSIEVNVKGNKESVLSFLKEMEGIKPIVNLVFIEYNESRVTPETPVVTALLRFESYALKLNTESIKLNTPKQFKNSDPLLIRRMSEEKFNWDKSIADKIQLINQN